MPVKLPQTLHTTADSRALVDPARFGDPIALRTEWTLARGGPSGDKLVEVSPARLEYRASLRGKLSSLVFLLIGLGLLVGLPASRLSAGRLSFDKDTLVPMLIGLVISAAGGYLLYSGTIPVVLDKSRGLFWKGRKAPVEGAPGTALGNCVKFEHIHALQLVSEYCSGGKSGPYWLYEMNLVLEDGRRVTVVVHGSKGKLRDEANVLSRFLGRPVWDAI